MTKIQLIARLSETTASYCENLAREIKKWMFETLHNMKEDPLHSLRAKEESEWTENETELVFFFFFFFFYFARTTCISNTIYYLLLILFTI